MTERKSTHRPRRRSAGATQIPKPIAQWFAGERSFSFTAGTWPYRFGLADYWDAWLQANPGAKPPANLLPYLQAPAPGTFMAEVAAGARKRLGL